MANCSQCGAKLPTFTFGEASVYCKTCRAQHSPAPKSRVDDALASFGNPGSRWLNATNVLIAINVSVFLAMVASSISWIDPETTDLVRWGASYGPSTLSGQYWRIITPSFVHIGIFHLVLNMWCLWSLGRLLERLIGPFATVGIYLTTAAGATLLSLSWNPMRVGAGASGAIFGIAGTLIPILRYGKLDLAPESVRKLLAYVVRFSLINLLYGLSGHIDNMAHLGGLVTGLLAGFFLARSYALPKEDQGAQRRNVLVATAIVVALSAVPVARAKSYAVELHKGETALDHNDTTTAIQHLKAYASARPDDAYGHAILGSAFHEAKRYPEAVQEYERALALSPDYGYVQVNLAKVHAAMGDFEKAIELFQAGIPHVEPDSDAYYGFAFALKATGDLAGAETAARKAIQLNSKNQEAHSLLAEILAEQKTPDKLPEKRAMHLPR